MFRAFTVLSFILISVLFTASVASAIELNWDEVNWSSGNETQTFTNVDGSGIDITISLSLSKNWETHTSGSSSYDTQTSWLSGVPDDNNNFGGDGTTEDNQSLYLGVNFASDDRTESYLDVTISFSQAVTGANFSLYDVDRYGTSYYGGYESGKQFVDVVEHIQGSYNETTVAANVTSGSKIKVKTNEDGTYYQGKTTVSSISDQADNPNSTLNLAWEAPVESLSFRYTTGSGAVADPGQQAIGLSSISFQQYNAVPEPSTYLFGGLSALTVIGSIIIRRRKKLAAAK